MTMDTTCGPRKRSILALLALMATMVLAPACAERDQLTPKQSNVWLVSESREIAIGQEVAKEVEKEYTVYQDPELNAYIDQIGQNLAKNSDRPNIKYRFRVLDSPIANAFATPGGNIYITRGILGVLDDEAELAGVLGHEIGHVCARHSAKQMQNSTLASIGLIAASVLLGDKVNDDMMQAANTAVSLIFLGYSRSDEDQADLLGTKYLYRTGYDPNAMIGVMEGLLELEKRKPWKAEQYIQTHPLTRDRIEHIRGWIPRIPREDVWGGTPPQTNLRGVETFRSIVTPHAIYPGGDDMQSALEVYRTALMRGQRDQVAKVLADSYKDDRGWTKSDYMAWVDRLINTSKKISYRMTKIETEPRRTGGAAKFEYVLEVTGANGVVSRETGRAYVEFAKSDPQIWKISSIRTVAG